MSYSLKTKDGKWLYADAGGVIAWFYPAANSGWLNFETREEAEDAIVDLQLKDVVIVKE